MFLHCDISLELWEGVENWTRVLGMENYNMSASKIVLGDLENAHFINTIILLTKKVIYNSMKKEQQPHLLNVKNETKKFYFEEKYRAYLKGKGNFFEKQFSLLSNIYNTTRWSSYSVYYCILIIYWPYLAHNFVHCFFWHVLGSE